tara:strand:+ start:644 stop:1333 length:690 start_codon:yes stop_codon:yes gene_type:complete
MGWWDEGILGGDEPLDDFYRYEELLGESLKPLYPLGDWDEKKRAKVRKALVGRKAKFLELMYKDDIYGQVGALIWMATGEPMPADIRGRGLACAKDDDIDGWSDTTGRKKAINEYAMTIRAYSGGVPLLLGDLKMDDPYVIDFTNERLLFLIQLLRAAQAASRGGLTTEQMMDWWQSLGLHHIVMEMVWPEVDADGVTNDEYARYLDEFEGQLTCALEAVKNYNGRSLD